MPQKIAKRALNTERQTELLRVVNECFEKYAQRGQVYYSLDGMTTAHVTLHAIQDFTTLKAFWPRELVRQDPYSGTVYQLQDDTMSKVQSAVRSSLEQLEDKGWVERCGNEHERRWRVVKEKAEKTKTVYDEHGKSLGTAQFVNGRWVL